MFGRSRKFRLLGSFGKTRHLGGSGRSGSPEGQVGSTSEDYVGLEGLCGS
jgi:hypothetical protein